MPNSLEVIQGRLAAATTFAEIFGVMPKGDLPQQLKQLKSRYKYLVKQTHPDQVEASLRGLANIVFPEVVRFYERAEQALTAGRYDKVITASGAVGTDVVFSSATERYTVAEEPYKAGDFSSVYIGQDSKSRPIIAKVATAPAMNAYLTAEATVIRTLRSKSAASGLLPYLPELVDTVALTEAGNVEYRVNVFRHIPGLVSLTDIHQAYPKGLPPEDAAWIWRRLLAQALAANVLGVVHGAIVPDHVLVHPTTREPLHLGWVHSVERPQERQARITTVIDRFRAWYPPEVFAREIPTHQTDLYMVGKTMIYLAGGDVERNTFPRHYPTLMKEVVTSLIAEDPHDRPADGHAVMRDFTSRIRQLWGKKYRPLRLPNVT